MLAQAVAFLEQQQATGKCRRDRQALAEQYRIVRRSDQTERVVEERLYQKIGGVVRQRD